MDMEDIIYEKLPGQICICCNKTMTHIQTQTLLDCGHKYHTECVKYMENVAISCNNYPGNGYPERQGRSSCGNNGKGWQPLCIHESCNAILKYSKAVIHVPQVHIFPDASSVLWENDSDITESSREQAVVYQPITELLNESKQLACKHSFHSACIDRWIQTSKNKTAKCPLCNDYIINTHTNPHTHVAIPPTHILPTACQVRCICFLVIAIVIIMPLFIFTYVCKCL